MVFSAQTLAVVSSVILTLTIASAQKHMPDVVIDTSRTGTPISQIIDGQFLVHGGDIVNTGFWLEMHRQRSRQPAITTNVYTVAGADQSAARRSRTRPREDRCTFLERSDLLLPSGLGV